MFKIAFAFGDEYSNYDLFATDSGADPISRVEDVSADVLSLAEDPFLVASANLDLPPADSTFDTGFGTEYEDPFLSADSGLPYEDPFELVSADSDLSYDDPFGLLAADSGLSTDTSLPDAGSDGENLGLPSDDSLFGGGIASNPIDSWEGGALWSPSTESQYLAGAPTCNDGEIYTCANGGGENPGDYYDRLYPASCTFPLALNTFPFFTKFDK